MSPAVLILLVILRLTESYRLFFLAVWEKNRKFAMKVFIMAHKEPDYIGKIKIETAERIYQ